MKKIIGILLTVAMLIGMLPIMAFALIGTGTEQDPVYVTNFAELKVALEEDKDTWIVVDEFNNGSYYSLIANKDYKQISGQLLELEDMYTCGAINIPTEKNKHLTINTTIDCRTASTKSGELLYCFINNRGNLTIDGTGTIAVSFNASMYSNAIIFNQGTIYIDAPITLDATCKTIQTYGRAIFNHSGAFDIRNGTYVGFKSKYLGTTGNADAISHDNGASYEPSVISGGAFRVLDEDGICKGQYALHSDGCTNLTLKGGTFYGIYASQFGVELTELLGKGCKYTILGADYDVTGKLEDTATLTIVNTNLIPTVDISITAPIHGNNPTAPTISTADATIYAYEWYDKNGLTVSNYYDTFISGETYRLQVRVHTTKEFAGNTEVMINGKKATVKSYGNDYVLCYYDFVALSQAIDTVQVGLDTPMAGGKVTAPYIYTDTVELTSHEWYPNVEYYEAGHNFKVTFRIIPKNGYEFSDNVKVILNGKQSTIMWKDKDFATCEYTFEIPAEEIETVGEINITTDMPVAGGTPPTPFIDSEKYTLGIHEWTPAVFVAGNSTKLTLLVYPSQGYKFVDGTTAAKVNGETAQVSFGQNYARVEFTYTVSENALSAVTILKKYGSSYDLAGKAVVEVKLPSGNGSKKITVSGSELYYNVARGLYVGIIDATAVSGDTLTGAVVEDTAPTQFVYGNVNNDANGAINSGDLLQFKLYMQSKTTFDYIKLLSADVNADGKINSGDLLQLKLYMQKGQSFGALSK